jgi:hypothetical protein
LTGIAGLKAMKRKKEIDDLWAQMQEDDDYYKKKSAGQSSAAQPSSIQKTKFQKTFEH